MTNDLKKLILIDGNAIMHRAFHALPPLTTKKGELVNAVYGFTSTLLSVIEKFHPEYLAVTFDLKGPTFRHEAFKEYKATRTAAPDEFYAQIPRVKEMVRAFNIPIFELQGFEADDVIGTLAKQAENLGGVEVVIATGDLDTLQLITSKVSVYTMRRGLSDAVLYDAEKVRERYGLAPFQVVDLKGLAGDQSDNIPGVKGIGEKTAISLLQKYETVEGVYAHLEETKGAVKTKLEKDRANALLSKQLATINVNVPVELDLEKTKVSDYDREKVVALLGEFNFFSLVKRLPGSTQNAQPAAHNPIEGVKDFKYGEITEDKLAEFWKDLEAQKEISIALDTANGKIKGIAFSWRAGRANYCSDIKRQLSNIKQILENDSIKKVGFDLKEIYKALNKEGVKLAGISWDVMIGAYALNPGEKIDFDKLVFAELGEDISSTKTKGQLQLGMENTEDTTEKICQVADYSLKLKEILEPKIESISQKLKKLFADIEMPLVEILAKMELQGIKINPLIFRGISETINTRILSLEKSIFEISGTEFNIASPKQLAEVLFEKMKLSTLDIKKGKTGYSTASGELEKLRGQNKVIEKIEEYRELSKLKNTYIDTLPLLIDENLRLHTTFNQAVTATGRLSSSEPNLQNIPIKTDLGQLLRTAFVAEDGYVLVSADYSQIDLRCVAHVSGDKNMIDAFTKGEDIHRATAAIVNKVSISQVTEKMRSKAKALNFGIIYGMSVFGFSASAGIDREEAKKFIDEYMAKFSGVAKYIRDTKESAKKNGYVETLIGRRRNIPEINSPNFQVQNSAERMAINMPIQGLSADIVKLAMVETFTKYESDTNIRMLLQIHDEIIWEVKREIAEDFGKEVKKIMENVYKLSVPLVVDIKIGDSWGEI
jgi:DNA polymerase-1